MNVPIALPRRRAAGRIKVPHVCSRKEQNELIKPRSNPGINTMFFTPAFPLPPPSVSIHLFPGKEKGEK